MQSFKVSKFKILFSAALFHHNKTLSIFIVFRFPNEMTWHFHSRVLVIYKIVLEVS